MFAAGIVEIVDILKEGITHLAARCPRMPPNQFGFDGREEGLEMPA
jgi:hypothetical protein